MKAHRHGPAARRTFLRTLAAGLAGTALLAGCATPGPGGQGGTLMVMGDSLSAGYGLAQPQLTGWVALMGRRLAAEHRTLRVANVSVSGETTRVGRGKIDALLAQHRPSLVVLELGADDALDGLSLAATQANLDYMTRAAQRAGARVLLVGVSLPSSFSADYKAAFAKVYADVAAATGSPLVPNLVDHVANAPNSAALYQADGLHPNERAQPLLLDNVWPTLRTML